MATAKQQSAMKKRKYIKKQLKNSWQLYVLLLLPVVYLLVFCYYPMYGIQIAFRRYSPIKGISRSQWVGLYYFKKFINSYEFIRLIKNTLVLSIYGLVAGFPFPIILALCLNYANNKKYMKTVQMVTYMPYFISTVVMVGILYQFLAPTGLFNNIVKMLGGGTVDFLGNPERYRHIYIWSGIWQGFGYGSVVYLSALSGIDPTLHEAAIVDGANKFQRMWHIDIPSILPTIIILLILNIGGILNTGFEKALLLQNPLNLRTSEVIDTYVYKIGLASDTMDYSYSTAIGLYKSIIGFILLASVNAISKKISDSSLW